MLQKNKLEEISVREVGSVVFSCYWASPAESFSGRQSQSYITTDSQSASLSWCQVSIWDPRTIFPLISLIMFRQLRVCWCGAPSLTRSQVCPLAELIIAVFNFSRGIVGFSVSWWSRYLATDEYSSLFGGRRHNIQSISICGKDKLSQIGHTYLQRMQCTKIYTLDFIKSLHIPTYVSSVYRTS
jgi:hypothetical protein